jgi:hypothetical protein
LSLERALSLGNSKDKSKGTFLKKIKEIPEKLKIKIKRKIRFIILFGT